MYHPRTDNSVVMARGKGEWGLGTGREDKRGMETSAVVSTIKIKKNVAYTMYAVLKSTSSFFTTQVANTRPGG